MFFFIAFQCLCMLLLHIILDKFTAEYSKSPWDIHLICFLESKIINLSILSIHIIFPISTPLKYIWILIQFIKEHIIVYFMVSF